jgi:hypothetical protein
MRESGVQGIFADIVSTIHAALIMFVVIVPLAPFSAPLLATHVAVVLGLVMHWVLRTDVCALTYMEAVLRGVPPDQSFIYSVVGPIFNLSDGTTRKIVFMATITLGAVSAGRLAKKIRTVVRGTT